MVSKDIDERELKRCIDAMVDEVSGMYCADLTDEAKIDAKVSDVRMRDQLISQMKEVIRCKKISERIMAEQMREVTYQMQIGIDSEGIVFSISRNDARSKVHSK